MEGLAGRINPTQYCPPLGRKMPRLPIVQRRNVEGEGSELSCHRGFRPPPTRCGKLLDLLPVRRERPEQSRPILSALRSFPESVVFHDACLRRGEVRHRRTAASNHWFSRQMVVAALPTTWPDATICQSKVQVQDPSLSDPTSSHAPKRTRCS